MATAGPHLGKSNWVHNDSRRRILHADGLTHGLRLELGHKNDGNVGDD